MEQTIKPIETIYNGYRFRSRLEARWAVFFDLLKITYEYENEGFQIGDEYYLPDFYLPASNTYVEVKGIGAFHFEFEPGYVVPISERENAHKYMLAALHIIETGANYIVVFGDPMSSIKHKSTNYLFSKGMCVLGETEYKPEDCNCEDCERKFMFCEFNPVFSENKLLVTRSPEDWTVAPLSDFIAITIWQTDNEKAKVVGRWNIDEDEERKMVVQTLIASQKARKARFEHGEKP